jgi:small subunit ribosomal protein S1
MDSKRIEQPEEYIGKKFDFRITKFEEGGRNIVVSRRKILDEERESSLGNFASEHKAGDVVTGKVARLENFGAFIELAPGLDGLAHISELAWSRVGHPSEVLKVGQEVNVKILKIETMESPGKLRISLSVKQTGDQPERAAGEDPWALVGGKYSVGAVVSGKVERREPYGLFVKLDDQVTGLLPKSVAQGSPEFPFDKIKVGDVVVVQVAEIRPAERRISLGVPKDPGSDDWKGYTSTAAQASTGGAFGTLGDRMKAVMEKGAQAKSKK